MKTEKRVVDLPFHFALCITFAFVSFVPVCKSFVNLDSARFIVDISVLKTFAPQGGIAKEYELVHETPAKKYSRGICRHFDDMLTLETPVL